MNGKKEYVEKTALSLNGYLMLIVDILLWVAGFFGLFYAATGLAVGGGKVLYGFLLGFSIVLMIVAFIGIFGLKIIRPNEALVMTLFGKYHGTLRKEGFFFVNPFVQGINPAGGVAMESDEAEMVGMPALKTGLKGVKRTGVGHKMSLKTMTLKSGKQKINDALGNPIIIGIVVIWRVKNTAMAAFHVDDYVDYLSTQADSALRSIVREYPYDGFDSESEKSLQGSSQEVAERIRQEIQAKVAIAGLEVMEARITHLAYAPEIASAMLQRQQASAIIDARAMIVDGAVGMVEMALSQLQASDVVELDEERRAQMVSNLLVVLCGNHDTQPIVNAGSLY